MIIDKGVIAHVIYPIFPPDQNASMVLNGSPVQICKISTDQMMHNANDFDNNPPQWAAALDPHLKSQLSFLIAIDD